MYKQNHVTVVMPALDEEQSIAKVIGDLKSLNNVENESIVDSIIVCDNGSTDNTMVVAIEAGAQVVIEPQRGYGSACLRALGAIDTTDIVVFIDADNAFFAEQTLALLEEICEGTDMVIGSRVLGHIAPNALTTVQKFGNHLAAFFIYHLWHHRYTDLGPFRAIRWSSLEQLSMCDTRYGWTVEMQVKAILHGLTITETPVDTRIRIGKSKISGTVSGSIKAGIGILGMIAKLYWQTIHFQKQKRPHRKKLANIDTKKTLNNQF